MIICKDCGAIDQVYTDSVNAHYCKNCNSSELAYVEPCKVCGEPTENIVDHICDGCKDEIAKAFEGLADMYAKELNITKDDVWDVVGEKCLW